MYAKTPKTIKRAVITRYGSFIFFSMSKPLLGALGFIPDL